MTARPRVPPRGHVTIWVDGDSCPVPVRDLLIRVARRGAAAVIFCARQELPLPEPASPEDAAGIVEMRVVRDRTVDEYLLDEADPENALVVTRDIPLAEKLLERSVSVMNDRGRVFERDSIRELRSLRDAAAAIRAQGLERMHSAVTYGSREQKAFADALDRFLARSRSTHPRNG